MAGAVREWSSKISFLRDDARKSDIMNTLSKKLQII